jgi:hypothetical protein
MYRQKGSEPLGKSLCTSVRPGTALVCRIRDIGRRWRKWRSLTRRFENKRELPENPVNYTRRGNLSGFKHLKHSGLIPSSGRRPKRDFSGHGGQRVKFFHGPQILKSPSQSKPHNEAKAANAGDIDQYVINALTSTQNARGARMPATQ